MATLLGGPLRYLLPHLRGRYSSDGEVAQLLRQFVVLAWAIPVLLAVTIASERI
jgi:hypothetical protein